MTRNEAWALLQFLIGLPVEQRRAALRDLPAPALRTIAEEWFWQAHGGQREPPASAGAGPGEWRIWMNLAGRGFGKTRAGAEWIWARVREMGTVTRLSRGQSSDCPLRIALVGGTMRDVARVMVKGPSGLIATAGTGEAARWLADARMLRLGDGAEAYAYSAEAPEALRGPEHHFAWCDELAKWRNADATWDNLLLGLRCGARPRALVTTTPRPAPLLKRIRGLEGLVETRGRTIDNLHLPEAFLAAMETSYGGTRLGRQELDGELIEDVEGALWTRATIEACRRPPRNGDSPQLAGLNGDSPQLAGLMKRVVVGVDPPASAAGTCGISVCGMGADGLFYVLADLSEAGLSPAGWATRVARAAESWGADRVVAEKNQGGDMVRAVLKNAAPHLPLELVSASRDKAARAEPVAMLFEQGEARFAGRFPALEDELAGLVAGGRYQGPGASPDRADAMVWAMTALMKPPAAPSVRAL